MKLKIIQWNLCSFQAQTNHLQLLINKYSPDVIALQETRFKDNKHCDLRTYKCFFKNRSTAAGGVALFIKKALSILPVTINSQFEVVAVRVLCDVQITLCNVYFPPNSNNFTISKSD